MDPKPKSKRATRYKNADVEAKAKKVQLSPRTENQSKADAGAMAPHVAQYKCVSWGTPT